MAGYVVLVSGPPAAGKTGVAVPLAQALGLPLLAKDDIKEVLLDALGGPIDLARSRQLGTAAMELMFALADRAPAAVLEANFRPRNGNERGRLEALGAAVVEVHCVCPTHEVARRFVARAAARERHPVHVLAELSPELLAEFEGPVALGEVIEVDTTCPVAIDDVARRVRTALASHPSLAPGPD